MSDSSVLLAHVARAQALYDDAVRLHEQSNASLARGNIVLAQSKVALARSGVVLALGVILLVAGCIALALAIHVSRSAPTLHSRRICVGSDCTTVGIPAGQCATVRGVTVCVRPDANSPGKVSP